jgi:hypothetical protein
MSKNHWAVNALWLLGQGVMLAISYGGLVTLGLLVLGAIALRCALVKNEAQLKRGSLWAWSPALTTIGIACIGSRFERTWAVGGTPEASTAGWAIAVLLSIGLILGVFAVFRSTGLRFLVASVVALELWYSIVVAFVANMSITGDWI